MYWRVSNLACVVRLGKRDFTVEMPDQPRHAVRLHCRQAGIELARLERAHLVQRASRDHGVEPRIDAVQQRVAVRRQKDLCRAGKIDSRRFILLVPIEQRAAGRQHHFERAGDAGAVVRAQSRGCGGIARNKLGMERGGALA